MTQYAGNRPHNCGCTIQPTRTCAPRCCTTTRYHCSLCADSCVLCAAEWMLLLQLINRTSYSRLTSGRPRQQQQHCTTLPLHHTTTAPHYHCTTTTTAPLLPLHHTTTAPYYHCTILPLHHCAVESLFLECVAVLLSAAALFVTSLQTVTSHLQSPRIPTALLTPMKTLCLGSCLQRLQLVAAQSPAQGHWTDHSSS